MKKNVCILLSITGLVFVLVACSSVQISVSNATPQAEQQQQQGQTEQQSGQPSNGMPAGNNLPAGDNMPVDGKLAMGTLSLEGGENAVTAEQAKTLLPLWKAVKSLSASDTTSQEELNSVYEQIQEAMTEQQVQAIKDMKMAQEETQALMEKYGVEMPKIDESRMATRAASAGQTQGGGTGGGVPGGGGMPGGGMPGGGMPGGEMPGGGMPGGEMPGAQGTPRAGQTPRAGGPRGGMGGMNTMFVEPLIKLLEERAGG